MFLRILIPVTESALRKLNFLFSPLQVAWLGGWVGGGASGKLRQLPEIGGSFGYPLKILQSGKRPLLRQQGSTVVTIRTEPRGTIV